MVATKAEGGRVRRHPGSGAFEFVGDDGASRRDGILHGADENINAGAVERRDRAGFHEGPQSVDDIRVERGQQRAVGFSFDAAREQGAKPEERRDPRFALFGLAAPGWNNQDHERTGGIGDKRELNR